MNAIFGAADFFMGLGPGGKLGALLAVVCALSLLVFGGVVLYARFSGWGEPQDLSEIPVEQQVVEIMGTRVYSPQLTHEASEVRRVASEHQTLIASIPTEPPPLEATPAALATQEALSFRLWESDEGGLPVTPFPSEDWFDPDRGLYFWRDQGGDWTTGQTRNSNPLWSFVVYDEYPDGVINFADGSMQDAIARKMGYEMVAVNPRMGSPTPAMIVVLRRNMGWEFREDASDKANVWSSFMMQEGNYVREFRVGGVLDFGLLPLPGGEGDYLSVGEFVPPFIVEAGAERLVQ